MAQRNIPGLDGFRAICVSLVIAGHICAALWGDDTPLARLGHFGVRVFFVISGFLITSLLLRELGRNGTISFSRFYFRRTMRLLPAAWVLISVSLLLARFGWLKVLPGEAGFAYSYLYNFLPDRSIALGHMWTLAVEEQFYLLWPVAFLLLGSWRTGFIVALIAAAPLFHLLSGTPVIGAFFVYTDALGIGCLLALMLRRIEANERYMCVVRSNAGILFFCAALAVTILPVPALVRRVVADLCTVLTVHWAMLTTGVAQRVLNCRAMIVTGVMSYSIYLWQQMFTRGDLVPLTLAVPCLALAAACSYYLVEKPFLSLRDRLERMLPA